MATVKAKLSQIVPNPFRDLETYSYQESKLASLKDSMLTSGSYWENILGRIKDYTPDMPWPNDGDMLPDGALIEQAYGHHRVELLRRMLAAGELEGLKGVEAIDGDCIISIPVQELDDPTMLKIMANENKDDGTSPIIPLLESCRQTEKIILSEIGGFGTFNEYVDSGGKFITAKAQWDQLKGKDTLGGPQIAKFFGETWSANDVTNAMRTIRMIEAGDFAQDEVTNFPSAGMLKSFCAYVDAVKAKEVWPEYFKKLTISKMAECISMEHADKADKPTVRTVQAAAKGLKGEDEFDGCLMARKGSTSRKWNPAIHIKQVLTDDPDLTDDQLIEQLGMDDFDGRDVLLEAGRKLYEAAQKKKEEAATGDEGENDATTDELDAAIADAGPETGESMPDLTVNSENIEQVIQEFVVAANNTAGIGAMLMSVGEEHTSDPDFIEAVNGLASVANGLMKVLGLE